MDCHLFIKSYGNGTRLRLCMLSNDIIKDYGEQVEIKLDTGTKWNVLNTIVGIISGDGTFPTGFIINRHVPQHNNKKQLDDTMQSLTSEGIRAFLQEHFERKECEHCKVAYQDEQSQERLANRMLKMCYVNIPIEVPYYMKNNNIKQPIIIPFQ